jgi:uncharacterized protein YjbI with pentapeptide repeats
VTEPHSKKDRSAQEADMFSVVDWTLVDAIFNEKVRSLAALAAAAGKSADTFFVGRDFRGLTLRGIDVRGVCLDNAILNGSSLRLAVIDETTSLKNAKIDLVDLRSLTEEGYLTDPNAELNRTTGSTFGPVIDLRKALAENVKTPKMILKRLAGDSEVEVRTRVALNT